MVAVFVACCVCVLDVAPHDRRQNGDEPTATTATAADDDEMLADQLLAKLDREHNTNCDVQIGDGMDIGIMGENGRNHLLLIRVGEKGGLHRHRGKSRFTCVSMVAVAGIMRSFAPPHIR